MNYPPQASGVSTNSFCSNCGSALPNIQFDGKLLVAPAGCIDSDIPMKPQAHISDGKGYTQTEIQSIDINHSF